MRFQGTDRLPLSSGGTSSGSSSAWGSTQKFSRRAMSQTSQTAAVSNLKLWWATAKPWLFGPLDHPKQFGTWPDHPVSFCLLRRARCLLENCPRPSVQEMQCSIPKCSQQDATSKSRWTFFSWNKPMFPPNGFWLHRSWYSFRLQSLLLGATETSARSATPCGWNAECVGVGNRFLTSHKPN